jgi:heme-degrading monooxygenase HmoA
VSTQETFRVMLRMRIKPGMAADFERTWIAVGDSVTSHPANLGQWLSHSADKDEDDTEAGEIYYIVSDWVSERAFREFETSDRHLEHRRKLHPYRSGGSMTTMRVVAHLNGSSATRSHAEWAAR